MWERFATAIKTDRIPLLDFSRQGGDFTFYYASACSYVHLFMHSVLMVLVIGYCDLEFVWNLVLVIWIFTIEQLVPDQSFSYRSDWTLAAGGSAET
jgi:hypothetical protein